MITSSLLTRFYERSPFDQEEPRLREDFQRELKTKAVSFDMEETYKHDREDRIAKTAAA
jgi:hypothetical protein